jgi:hypothetical protein
MLNDDIALQFAFAVENPAFAFLEFFSVLSVSSVVNNIPADWTRQRL